MQIKMIRALLYGSKLVDTSSTQSTSMSHDFNVKSALYCHYSHKYDCSYQ